jgi:hypothetical protein
MNDGIVLMSVHVLTLFLVQATLVLVSGNLRLRRYNIRLGLTDTRHVQMWQRKCIVMFLLSVSNALTSHRSPVFGPPIMVSLSVWCIYVLMADPKYSWYS